MELLDELRGQYIPLEVLISQKVIMITGLGSMMPRSGDGMSWIRWLRCILRILLMPM